MVLVYAMLVLLMTHTMTTMSTKEAEGRAKGGWKDEGLLSKPNQRNAAGAIKHRHKTLLIKRLPAQHS